VGAVKIRTPAEPREKLRASFASTRRQFRLNLAGRYRGKQARQVGLGSNLENFLCWLLVRNAHKAAVNQAPGNWSSRLIPAVGHVIANGRFGERRPYCAAQHSVIDTPVSAPPRCDGNTRQNEASVAPPTLYVDDLTK